MLSRPRVAGQDFFEILKNCLYLCHKNRFRTKKQPLNRTHLTFGEGGKPRRIQGNLGPNRSYSGNPTGEKISLNVLEGWDSPHVNSAVNDLYLTEWPQLSLRHFREMGSFRESFISSWRRCLKQVR